MRKTILSSILFCQLLAGSAFAYSISMVPPTGGIPVGGSGQVNVNLSLDPGEELFGFSFALNYDSTLLSLQSLSFGEGLGNYLTGYTPGENQVTFDGALFGESGITSSTLPLTALSFAAIGQGSSLLDLAGQVLDMNQSDLLDLTASATVDTFTPAPVPEPGTAILFCSALLGMALFKRNQAA